MTGPIETLHSIEDANVSEEVEEAEEDEEEDYEEEEEDDEDRITPCECCGCTSCRFTCVGGKCADEYAQFIEHIEARGFKLLGQGGFRRTYIRKNVVIKVPHVNDGRVDNRVEAAAWHKYKSKPTDLGLYLAPCRLLPNGCLMMVALKMWDWAMPKPVWASKIDSGQIGMHKGKPVAYDFALDLTERDHWEEEWNQFSVFFQEDWLDRKPHLRKNSAA